MVLFYLSVCILEIHRDILKADVIEFSKIMEVAENIEEIILALC